MAFALALVLPWCGAAPAFAQAEPAQEIAPAATTPPENPDTATPDDSVATPENAVEQDAQAYTRLVVRHDSLAFKEEMRQITAAERDEMAAIPARGAAIARKYSPGGEQAAQAAAYRQRVKELSATVVATARATWITDAFPTADAVIRAFSTDAERLATLEILLDLLEYRVNPSPPPTVEKKNGYRRAIARISPPAQYDATLFAATKRLRESRQFRLDVISRFVPAFATGATGELRAQQYQTETRGNLFVFWAALGGTVLYTLVLPLAFLARGQHARVAPVHRNPNEAFQLPPELSDAKLFRRTCGLAFDCGRVKFQEGEIVTIDTPDTREIKMRLIDFGGRSTEKLESGDIVSLIARGRDGLVYYRHSTGKHWVVSGTFEALIKMPVDRLFWASFGGLIVLFWGIYEWVYPLVRDVNPLLSAALGAWGLLMFLVLYYYIGFMHIFVKKIRRRQLDRWIPRLEAFIDDRTPLVRKALPAPRDPMRARK